MSIAISGVRRRQRRRRPVIEQRFLNPGKGINLFGSDQLIDDREGSNAMNASVVETGGITKRNGWEAVGSGLTTAPRGLAAYYPTVSDRYLLTIDGSNLKYLNGIIWTAISGATFTPSERVDFVQANGKLFIHNGINPTRQLSGLTLTAPLTTVESAAGIFYADKHIVFGVDQHPNRLYISGSDPGDFTNTNPTGTGTYSVYDSSTHPGATAFAGSDARYIDININDGDKITGLAKYLNKLIIFKERSIYSLEFDSSGVPTVKLVTNSIGCVSHWSIDEVNNDILFLSRRGIYVLGQEANYFDQIRTNELSIRIKPLISSITPANLGRSSAVFNDDVYHIAVPVGGVNKNNRVITYHRQYSGWLQSNNINANTFCEYIDSNNVEGFYYADENTATVWKRTTGYNDGDQAIDMYWESKAYDFGAFDITKRFVDCTLLFRQLSGSVSVTITIDGNRIQRTYNIPGTSFSGGMGRSLLGRALLGGRTEAGSSAPNTTTTNIPIRLPIGENGRTIKIRVANSNPNENFVLLGFNFGYRPYGRNNFPSELRVY